MKHKIMRKFLSITLSLAIMLSMCVSAFAVDNSAVSYEINGENVSIQMLSSTTLLISEDSDKSLVTFSENNNIVTTTVQNMTSGKREFFIRDCNTGTLYSSITGYTGVVHASEKGPGTYRISYKELLAYVSIAAGATEIVAGICAIAGVTAASSILGIVGGLMAIISGGLALQDEDSGIEYTLDYVTISKYQGGRKYTVDVLKVVDVGTY